eukprot:Gregarina_sp_Pseudo_9__5859@NODE_909_length_2070_cov_45_107829_g853_i0_p3_GENE_NODE_909_length_2070_cov_45_107829_g853_i0NODE_909_length_2070_cov_45_107829_g853_i0_p3_ORF_typecomplete_len189_score32_96NOT2_3_5/PF04153_18/1_2e12_NODE_909_length_2070_cov_45_107829_g853_i015022014
MDTASDGVNLINLHLDLGACELLCPRFSSPWTSQECATVKTVEVDPNSSPSAELMDSNPWFSEVPSCYVTNKGSLKSPQLSAFHIETIFFFFYFRPRTQLQLLAAAEATARGWRLHQHLGKWILVLEEQPPVYFCPHQWTKCPLEEIPPESALVPQDTIRNACAACLEAS